MRPRPEGRGEPRRRPCARLRSGFNAATTRRPWRTGRASRVTPAPASMRPRPEGRGERRSQALRWTRSWKLQCGHDPKAVENPNDFDGRATAPELQCGHDPKAVENATRDGQLKRPASFNAATTRRPWRTANPAGTPRRLPASMRPRPEGRGEPVIASVAAAKSQLQCGHDPKAVENDGVPRSRLNAGASMRPRPEGRGEPAGRKRRGPCRGLQCGHDPKAVENAPLPIR